jgi:hypothetical protein
MPLLPDDEAAAFLSSLSAAVIFTSIHAGRRLLGSVRWKIS